MESHLKHLLKLKGSNDEPRRFEQGDRVSVYKDSAERILQAAEWHAYMLGNSNIPGYIYRSSKGIQTICTRFLIWKLSVCCCKLERFGRHAELHGLRICEQLNEHYRCHVGREKVERKLCLVRELHSYRTLEVGGAL